MSLRILFSSLTFFLELISSVTRYNCCSFNVPFFLSFTKPLIFSSWRAFMKDIHHWRIAAAQPFLAAIRLPCAQRFFETILPVLLTIRSAFVKFPDVFLKRPSHTARYR